MKPTYKLPTMKQVAKMKGASGLTAISTFSGCGGSCLGLEMAGFDVRAACEFIPEARAVYALNHKGVPIDPRDIRDIQVDELLALAGLEKGEVDLLEGSPPCAAFSTAGSRSDKWGAESAYSGTTQRTDDLFYEFARLLEGIQPKAFIAENVSGLVKGVSVGYFKEIHQRLTDAGYIVEARLLNAMWLGVPQSRIRLIFIGVRNDLGLVPSFPTPNEYRYTMRDACPWFADLIPEFRQGGWRGEERHDIDKPAPTIQASQSQFYLRERTANSEKRPMTIPELKLLCSFPEDFKLTGSFNQQWERLGRAVPPMMMKAIGEEVVAMLNGERPAPEVRPEHPKAEAYRALMLKRTKSAEKKVGLLLSNGADSNAILAAMLRNNRKPTVISFRLDDRESKDWRAARATAKLNGLKFEDVQLTTDIEELERQVRAVIALGITGKANIECSLPVHRAIDRAAELGIKELLIGTGPGVWGLHRREVIDVKDGHQDDPEWIRALHQERRLRDDPAQFKSNLAYAESKGIKLVGPLFDSGFIDILDGSTWNELNRPMQKQPLRDAFPEIQAWGVASQQINLQLGDSGISDNYRQLLDTPLNTGKWKSTVGLFNAMAKGEV